MHFLPREAVQPAPRKRSRIVRYAILALILGVPAALLVRKHGLKQTPTWGDSVGSRVKVPPEPQLKDALLNGVNASIPTNLPLPTQELMRKLRTLYADQSLPYITDQQSHAQAEPISLEMVRLLKANGVTSALDYFQPLKPELLARIASSKAQGNPVRNSIHPLSIAAQLYALTGQKADAVALFREAIALDPECFEFQLQFKQCLRIEAVIAFQIKNFHEAEALIDEAVTCSKNLPPDSFQADCLLLQSRVAYSLNALDKAARCAESSVELQKTLLNGNPASTKLADYLAESLSWLADTLEVEQKPAELKRAGMARQQSAQLQHLLQQSPKAASFVIW